MLQNIWRIKLSSSIINKTAVNKFSVRAGEVGLNSYCGKTELHGRQHQHGNWIEVLQEREAITLHNRGEERHEQNESQSSFPRIQVNNKVRIEFTVSVFPFLINTQSSWWSQIH